MRYIVKRLTVLMPAWLAYALSWLLPTVESPSDLAVGLYGWGALRVALSPVWPYKGIGVEGYWSILSVASALSNLVMLASPLALLHHSSRSARMHRYGAIVVFLLNAWWPLSFGSFEGLRAGYFVWWGSFGLLAIAMQMKGAAESVPTRGLTTA